MKLRDYQEESVNKVNELLPIHKSMLLILCTGSGKTVVMAHLAKQRHEKDQTVLLIAHRQELISQASITMASFGLAHKLVCPKSLEIKIKQMHFQIFGKSFINPFSGISIGSAQTVVRRLDKLQRPDLLLIDEAAHATSNLWRKTIEYFNTFTLGVTATPTRSDRQSLGEVFNHMYVGKDMKSIIEDGQLCPYVIYSTPEEFDLSEVKRIKSGESKGDYNRTDLEKQIDKPKIVGRAVEHYEKFAKGKPAMVFAVSIKHADHIAKEFRDHGYNFVSINGGTDDKIRYDAFQDLKNHKIDGIVNVDIAGEGVSVDGVEVVIMLRPISELAFGLYAQQIGRALRLAPGKERGIIIDMCQNARRHGFVEDKTDWTLWEGEEKKKRGKKDDEETVKVKTCPECFTTHKPAPFCPECNYVYPAANREYEQVDGDLVELQREQELKQRKTDQNAGIREATTKADLIALDKKLGMKRGASAHKQRAIEEKKKAMARVGRAIDYYKQNIAWGSPEVFDRLMFELFDTTERDARKLSAAKANKLCDTMREFLELRNSQIEEPYSSLNYRMSMFNDVGGF